MPHLGIVHWAKLNMA